MPNWAEGNIRFRGKPENIMAFLKNELECTATERGFETVSFPPDVVWNDLDEVTLSEPEEERNKPGRYWKSFYIRGTRRNFIDVIAGVYLPRDAKEWIIILDSFKAAWCCFAEPYIEKSKKYGIDIAIVLYERGCQFRQRIEIVNGQLVEDETQKFADWDWEADFPNMGG